MVSKITRKRKTRQMAPETRLNLDFNLKILANAALKPQTLWLVLSIYAVDKDGRLPVNGHCLT
ncbi:hypothetical protein MASR1M36_03040 [Candidatus Cloacimonadaceae bacterium]